MKIGNGGAGLIAQHRLDQTLRQEEKQSFQLSSGDRIYRAAYDPSGLAISEKMKSRMISMQQAEKNANDSISLFQVAEGALTEIHSMGIRMKELALQSANDTITDEVRRLANMEFQALKREIGRLSDTTSFNGRKVLNSEAGSYDFQVGINNKGTDRIFFDLKKAFGSGRTFGVDGESISNKNFAQKALLPLDNLVANVSRSRAMIGTASTRMEKAVSNSQISRESEAASNSKIRDVDFASATAEKAKTNIKKQAGMAMVKMTADQYSRIERLIS